MNTEEPSISRQQPTAYMQTLVWAMHSLWLSLTLLGCTQQGGDSKTQGPSQQREVPQEQEVSGEMFNRTGYKDILKQSGSVIRFLTESEHEGFEALLHQWREKQYETERAVWDTTHNAYLELFEKYKKEDGLVHDPAVIERLNEMEMMMTTAKARVEYRSYDKLITTDERFLSSLRSTAADSEGKFRVRLPLRRVCSVLAWPQIPVSPERCWYFRYIPDGTPLVLSDGNAMWYNAIRPGSH